MSRVDNRLMLTVPAHTPYRRHRSSSVALSIDADPECGKQPEIISSSALANRQMSHGRPVTANSSVKLVCQSSGIDRRVTREPVMA
jgi:hypothetical protein